LQSVVATFLARLLLRKLWRLQYEIVTKSLLRLAEFLSTKAAALWKENTSAREIKDTNAAAAAALPRTVVLICFLNLSTGGCVALSVRARASNKVLRMAYRIGVRNQTNLLDQHLSMDADSRISSVGSRIARANTKHLAA
jgi:hypothetical protein